MTARELAALRRATPARLGVGRAGTRSTTAAMLKLRADHARAVDAVMTEVSPRWVRRSRLAEIRSSAASREQFLLRPELGRRVAREHVARLSEMRTPSARGDTRPTVLICVGDGLSCAAVETNAAALLAILRRGLVRRYRLLTPLFVRNARVRIEDHIGTIMRPDVVCMLIGERPGLVTAESLSAYVIYRPSLKSREPDRTVISNIHRGGLRMSEAARKITALIDDAIRYRASGSRLAELAARVAPGCGRKTPGKITRRRVPAS